MRILCLHGYRTSGSILSRQMASLQCHVRADFVFINAPFQATGEPDEGIRTYYPNMSYYEWNTPDGHRRDLNEAIDYLLTFIKEKGPFDGILGFSQGACMATYLALRNQKENIVNSIKFLILIGGVPPPSDAKQSDSCLIELPSLHVWGEEDFVLEDSQLLKSEWYHPETSLSIFHPGGHHIPTLRSGVYSVINNWIHERCPKNKI